MRNRSLQLFGQFKNMLMLVMCILYLPLSIANSQSLKIIVPFAPGGDTDLVARRMAPILKKYLGQTNVEIMNVVGNDGLDAIQKIKQMPADGTVLILGSLTSIVLPFVIDENRQPEWENLKYLNVATMQPLMCVTGENSTIKNFRQFMELAKSSPKKLRYSVVGSYSNFFPTYLLRLAGIPLDRFSIVRATSSKHALQLLEENKIDFVCASIPQSMPYINAKRVRPLFSNSARTLPEFPDLPGSIQTGLHNLDRFVMWTVLAVNKATPDDKLVLIRTALNKLGKDPDWINSDVLHFGMNGISIIKNPLQYVREEATFYENLANHVKRTTKP